MSTPEQLLETAKKAAAEFSAMRKDQVEAIARKVSAAALEKSQFYAEWAVNETGYGDADGKKIKNDLCASVVDSQDFDLLAGYKVDEEKKIIRFAKPAGVVVALIPCTNPVATIYFKSLCTLMTRNAVILCPHPAAKECSTHAAHYLTEVAEAAGAPKGSIQIVEQPSIPLVDSLMKSDDIDVILATGGPAMVRAAYSSGNPAIGVGPGNVPCYVDASANVAKAGGEIPASKSFDNSLPCACESVVIAHQDIADELREAMAAGGAQFITDAGDLEKLTAFLFPEGALSPYALGRSAQVICEQSGIEYQEGAKILVVDVDSIDGNNPYCREKMCPVVGFLRVADTDAGIEAAHDMLKIMGAGHSAVVHAQDPAVTARYGQTLPVCRITANSLGVTGASGFGTNLDSGVIIGTGYFGRSSVYENIGAKHLVQYTALAYSKEPEEVLGDIDGALAAL